MTIPPPAEVGMPLLEIDTPALLVDLDALERNLARMADAVAKTKAKLRPHAKTHKSPIIAQMQIARGAVGVCCQKVSEAEAMVRGGVKSVLVSNEVTGGRKLDRLAALAREADVAVCTDNRANVVELAHAAERAGIRLAVLVEIDVGAGRCGVPAGSPAVELARAIAASEHLRFAGLQAYQGRAQHVRDYGERKAAINRAIQLTADTVDALKSVGLSCEIVGGAGTGTFELEAASGVYNELQAGSYVFMDADYARNRVRDGGAFQDFEHALFVYVTVMSTPAPERAVVDAGHKALSNDSGMPELVGFAGASYGRPSDEHGVLDLTRCNDRPLLGDKILLIPGHCDPTVNLHDWYVGVRGFAGPTPVVESVWPIAARGAVF
jgi:D-serine deaminase-like pyridoxal phosphate-dependent protein